MSNSFETLERDELIKKLIDNGYRELVEALLYNEGEAYTRKGRANKSGMCRILKWKTKQLEDAFEDCRRILGTDTAQE